MLIVFRLNISKDIGTGHFYRCKTLANKFIDKNHDVRFICNHEAKKYIHELNFHEDYSFYFLNPLTTDESQDFLEVSKLFETLDEKPILFLDSYSHTLAWEKAIYPYTQKFVVLDDLGNKVHHADFIIDPTYGRVAQEYFLDQESSIALTGTQFAILPEEYLLAREKMVKVIPDFSKLNIHLFFGGVDSNNYTEAFAKYLLDFNNDIKLHIVTGALYNYKKNIDYLVEKYPNRITHYHNTKKMWDTLIPCNLAVGAPGITTWERAALGIPSIYMDIIENQKDILKQLADADLCEYIGSARSVTKEVFYSKFSSLINNTKKLNLFRTNSFSAVDAKGVLRIVEILEGAIK